MPIREEDGYDRWYDFTEKIEDVVVEHGGTPIAVITVNPPAVLFASAPTEARARAVLYDALTVLTSPTIPAQLDLFVVRP